MFQQLKNLIFRQINNIRCLRFVFYSSFLIFDHLLYPYFIGRWIPIVSQVYYPFLPDFLLSEQVFLTSRWFFLLFSLLAAFSIYPKISSVAAFLFGTIYFVLAHSTGHHHHHLYLAWHILLIFSIFENFNNFSARNFIFVVRLLFVLVFFSAGITKIRNIGIEWFDENTLIEFLVKQRLSQGSPLRLDNYDLNYWMLKYSHVAKYFYYMTFPLELAAPLVLFRKFRNMIWIFAVLQVVAAYGFYAIFSEFIALYFFWLIDENKIQK